jgi:hypothetical protein
VELEAVQVDEEVIAEMQKSEAERRLEEIEFKDKWGEPDPLPPLLQEEIEDEVRTDVRKYRNPFAGATMKSLMKEAPMDRAEYSRAYDIARHSNEKTPLQLLEVIGQLPPKFVEVSGIPVHWIAELPGKPPRVQSPEGGWMATPDGRELEMWWNGVNQYLQAVRSANERKGQQRMYQQAKARLAASGSIIVYNDGRRVPISEVGDDLLGKCLRAGGLHTKGAQTFYMAV